MSEGQKQPPAAASIKHSAARGLKWTGLFSVFNALTAPALKIFLARALTPTDFAHIAIVSLAVSASRLINNMGLSEAVIQRKDVSPREVSSVFFLTVMVSAVVAAALFLGAGAIQRFYGFASLQGLLQVVSLSVVISGSTSLFRVYLQKNLFFRETILSQIGRSLANLVTVVVLILLGYGLYGYAIGNIAGASVQAVMLVYFAKRKTDIKIRLYFGLREVAGFLKFSVFVSLKQVLTFASIHIDEVIIGKFLAPEIFGIYFFAKDFLNKPHELIGSSFTQVLFPVFSRLNDSRERLRSAYLRITRTVSFLAFPIFVGIGLTAHLFVPVVFGQKWLPAVYIIQIFSSFGVFRVMTSNIASSLLYSINRPNTVFYIDLFTTGSYFLLLLGLSRFGLNAVLAMYGAFIFSKVALLQITVGRALGTPLLSYFGQLRGAFLATLVMVGVTAVPLFAFPLRSELVRFFASCGVGVVAYVAGVYLIDRSSFREIGELVMRRAKR